jgi:hypothetical protein
MQRRDSWTCPRCHDTSSRNAYCAACQREYDSAYVTADSNGNPYHTFCGAPVTHHRGTTPRRLGACPVPADD